MHATDPSTTMDDLVFIVVVFIFFFLSNRKKWASDNFGIIRPFGPWINCSTHTHTRDFMLIIFLTTSKH